MMAAPTELTDARDEALQAMRARLRTFIERRVGDPDVAEDLTQDVLLRLLMNDDRQIENPTAWLYRVARNAIIDYYRTRRDWRPFGADGPTPPGLAEDPFADDSHEAQRELAGCLRSLVDQLAEPYRSALIDADLAGQTQAEAARSAGVSISGMKSRVQRGRRLLHHLLTECCRVYTGPTGSIRGYEPAAGCGESPQGGGAVPGHCGCAGTPP